MPQIQSPSTFMPIFVILFSYILIIFVSLPTLLELDVWNIGEAMLFAKTNWIPERAELLFHCLYRIPVSLS